MDLKHLRRGTKKILFSSVCLGGTYAQILRSHRLLEPSTLAAYLFRSSILLNHLHPVQDLVILMCCIKGWIGVCGGVNSITLMYQPPFSLALTSPQLDIPPSGSSYASEYPFLPYDFSNGDKSLLQRSARELEDMLAKLEDEYVIMILERAYEGALKAHVVPITQKVEASQEQMPPSKAVFAPRGPLVTVSRVKYKLSHDNERNCSTVRFVHCSLSCPRPYSSTIHLPNIIDES